MDCHTKFVLKQEFEDAGPQEKPSREECVKVLSQPSTKCGEVFLGYGGRFTLVCEICSNPFENLESFGDHIQDSHLNSKSGIDFSCIEEIFVDIHNDPLVSSPAAGNWIGPKQVEPSNQLVQMKKEITQMSPENELERLHQGEDTQNEPIVSINSTKSTGQKSNFTCDLCDCTFKYYKSHLAHIRTHGMLTKRMRNKLTHQISENAANNCKTTSPVSDTTAKTPDEESMQHFLKSESEITTSMLDADSVSKDNEYVCIVCERKYKHKRSLLFHIRKDHRTEMLQPLSDFPNRLAALAEDEDELEKSDQEHRCKICSRMYRHRKSLDCHMRNEHYENASHISTDGTVCKYCDKQFSCNDLLETHIQNDHPSDKKFVCPHCPKTFKNRFTRQGHINTHTGERPFKCPHCPRAFSNSSNLSVHIRMHLQIKSHCCSFCGKAFISTSERKRHEMTHTGEKPHQCEECGKRYHTSGKLTEHQRRHKNIKNYKCDVCSKTFYSWSMLKDHKMAHSSERPFTCNVCGQNFPRKRALRVHEQLHSDVKKYVCNTCGKAFAQCAGLYSHKKSHGEIK